MGDDESLATSQHHPIHVMCDVKVYPAGMVMFLWAPLL